MNLRHGLTTGTCAAAAAKAAAILLDRGVAVGSVELILPSGPLVTVPVERAEIVREGASARAVVRKDAGDDPDVTDGMKIHTTIRRSGEVETRFFAGEGVGIVTRPGLQVPPGQPAINPVPRQMILAAIEQVARYPVEVEVAIPGGKEVAEQTFNPRLGIVGGLSILGTSGIVRPYCRQAMHDALKCELDVAEACGIESPILVAGNIGSRAAGGMFTPSEQQLVEVGNEWGFTLSLLPRRRFRHALVLGHPGKLGKLPVGDWDTHSSRSRPAVESIRPLCRETLGHSPPDSPTAEGLFAGLVEAERAELARVLASRIRLAIEDRIGCVPATTVALVDMAGRTLGVDGSLQPWT